MVKGKIGMAAKILFHGRTDEGCLAEIKREAKERKITVSRVLDEIIAAHVRRKQRSKSREANA